MSKLIRPTRCDVRIFVSYAHADPPLFKKSLETLLRWPDIELVTVWSDYDILPGSDPDKRIRQELEVMDIFIALISPMFAASKYIHEVEVPTAKSRCEKGAVHVVPIIVTDPGAGECEWLKTRELLPDKRKTWTDIRKECRAPDGEYDLAIQPIRDGLRKVIDATIAKKDERKR